LFQHIVTGKFLLYHKISYSGTKVQKKKEKTAAETEKIRAVS